ncbi:hypothetical protein GQ473_00165 [archaeon]|nr:hypothetical protein [archaeon]
MSMKRSAGINIRDTITYEPDMMKTERYSFIKLLSSVYNLTPNQSDDLNRIYKMVSGENNKVLFNNIQWENIIIGIMSYVMKDTEFNILTAINNTYSKKLEYHVNQIYRISTLLSEIIDNDSLYMN